MSRNLRGLLAWQIAAVLAAPPVSARVMFYDPSNGDPAVAKAQPSEATGLTPVGTTGTRYVGVHYWFENDRGDRFADPAAAGVGSRITLHMRGNVSAFLTVWMSDASHPSVELTPRSHAGPAGAWPGYLLAADQTFVVQRDFLVAPAGENAERVIIFLARSQTEQVNSMAAAREKLQRIAAVAASDGLSALAQEVDRTTPGQIGTYVVHRWGAQTGGEIVLGRTGAPGHVANAAFDGF